MKDCYAFKYWKPTQLGAQSAGAIKYTDCTSAEG